MITMPAAWGAKMSPDDMGIRDACVFASADLEVRIVSPFSLTDSSGNPVEFIALFPDFGSQNGAAVCHLMDWPLKSPVASQHGVFCAGLHPDAYREYSRKRFIETLNDWSWQGKPWERPKW